ncbi:MAG: DUF1996 domain-containing protein [Mycobacterium leprae]
MKAPLLRRRGIVLALLAVAVLLVTGAGGTFLVQRQQADGPSTAPGFPAVADFIAIGQVPRQPPPLPAGPDASTGTFVSPCGRNENGHHNADNVITSPGKAHGAHHVHEYVGNVSTDASSTDYILAAATTTCSNADLSSYYWPVLRVLTDHRDTAAGKGRHGPSGHDARSASDDGTTRGVAEGAGAGWDGGPHNSGTRLAPTAVLVQFRGNPASNVFAMPRFLRLLAGDARASATQPVTAGVAQWSCSGSADRRTPLAPLCPAGQHVLRIYDFPSCWDDQHTDSPNHRAHTAFPAPNGLCPRGTVAIPQLHLEVAYRVPPGRGFAIDTFPEQGRNPITDHADFINVMPDYLMDQVVACLNSGQHC